MKEFIAHFLCALGKHEFRERINGKSTERVCMRRGCEHHDKLYAVKQNPSVRFFNKETVHNHNIKKVIK